MNEAKIITPENTGFIDFQTLRKAGIDHLAALSGNIWTDHNLHDPGITMLEALCYVLTDLDYRTRLDFKDLVARRNNEAENNFFTPAQILGNNPLTITDYRKLLIDIKGVRNAWLEKVPTPVTVANGASHTGEACPCEALSEPAGSADYTLSFDCATGQLSNTPPGENTRPVPLNGLYRVYIEPDDVYAAAYENDACGVAAFPMEAMLQQVEARLHNCRNLCEDFAEVAVLKSAPISLCLHIELAADFNPEEVLVKVFGRIQDFFSPAPQFYTLGQLLEKGKTMDEIFEGRPYDFDQDKPLQQNGFIDTAELEQLERHTVIYASDLYRIIMEVPGVAGITRLVMFSHAGGTAAAGQEWCLQLQPQHRPILAPELSTVLVFRNRLPFGVDLKKVKERYTKTISDYNKSPRKATELDTVVPGGRQLELSQYHSVQYEFPQVYLVGKNEMPRDATAARKAQSLQLQAYLLFYDRLLADYFAQLSKIRDLFALNAEDADSTTANATYFPADLTGIPQLPALLRYAQKPPAGSAGTLFQGAPLAYEPDPENNPARRTYSSQYLRDEAIARILDACNNNAVTLVTETDTDGYYHFRLALSGNLQQTLLQGYAYFETEKEAEQAARDIAFLASLSDAYTRVNDRDAEQYSFDLVYNDAGYTEMIAALYETTDQYYARKDRFLNHLLARFSEDFTDYVLMMYSLNGKKNDPAANIRDKAGLLSVYPDISANRGKAFNYRSAVDGFPVCGLQKRVSHLMGVRRAPGLSLNNFDKVAVATRYIFHCYLPGQGTGDTPLFVSRSSYNNEAEAAAAGQALLELAAQQEHYKKYGCTAEGVYGFYIQGYDPAGTWIDAYHPVAYTTARKRDELLEWMVTFWSREDLGEPVPGFDLQGKYVRLVLAKEGFYFLLHNEQGKLLFKSIQGYETWSQAFTAGCECLEWLQQDAAYHIIYQQDAAHFAIQVWDTGQQPAAPLAKHPLVFSEETDAEKALEQLQQYFHRRRLVYQKEYTNRYKWELEYQQQSAWESAFTFHDKAQLPVAFMQFLQLAIEEQYYEAQRTPENKYTLQVVRRETTAKEQDIVVTVIARHLQVYETEEAVAQAIKDDVALFRDLLHTLQEAMQQDEAAATYFIDPEPQAALPAWLLNIALDTRPGLLWKATKVQHYYFHISDKEAVLLQEPAYYTSLEQVRRAFYDTIRLGKSLEHYHPTVTDGCSYGFFITDGTLLPDATPRPLALHPQEYLTAKERDAAIQRVWRYLLEHGQTLDVIKQVGSWRAAWHWLSCCGLFPEVALELLEEKQERQQAIDALQAMLQLAAIKATAATTGDVYYAHYEIAQQEEGYQVYLRDGTLGTGKRLAIHPRLYDCPKQALLAAQRMIEWAGYPSTTTISTDGGKRFVSSGPYHALPQAVADTGFRLWDRQYRIAAYYKPFKSQAERQEAIQELLPQYQQHRPSYTALETGSTVVIAIGNQYYFQLRQDGCLLWQSANGYDSPEEARRQFTASYLHILQQATDKKHFSTWQPAATRLYLYDNKKTPIAFYEAAFGSVDDYEDAVCLRQETARLYPVYYREGSGYGFRLYNTSLRLYEWNSTAVYDTAAAAAADFYLFLQLLQYSGHYCLEDQPEACRYTITLGKVLLDLQYIPEQDEAGTPTREELEAKAWRQLDTFLANTVNPDEIFYAYTDFEDHCRYAFRVVSNTYRVARHNGWYHSTEKREKARLQLLADINCKERLYGWLIRPEINDAGANIDPRILACYFPQPEKADINRLWLSYEKMPGADQWKPELNTTDQLYYYHLREKYDAGQPCKYIWRSVNGYSDDCEARRAEHFHYVYLLELARSAASYWYMPLPGKEKRYTLYLKDMDGQVVAVAPGTICEADLEMDQTMRMLNAMLYPIIASGNGYTFEINNLLQYIDEGTVSWEYETIWEGLQEYASPEEAFAALEHAVQLLKDLRNYQRVEDEVCGPFSLELTDPAQVLAAHPLTYTSLHARNAAIEAVKAAINSEGMHVLEHLLLRPRQAQLSYEVLGVNRVLYNGIAPLRILSRTVFPDPALSEKEKFVETLNLAINDNRVYIEDQRNRYIVSFWDEDQVLAASAVLRKSTLLPPWEQFCADVRASLQVGFTPGDVITGSSATDDMGDALLSLCPDVGLCEERPAGWPADDYCDLTFSADPYSFWATVVLPGWPQRFQSPRFRQFFENNLRKEAPAHIRLRMIWVSPEHMYAFEKAYRQWLAAFSRADSCDYRESLSELAKVLMSIKNVYPPAVLYDETGGGENPVVLLDETTLPE